MCQIRPWEYNEEEYVAASFELDTEEQLENSVVHARRAAWFIQTALKGEGDG